MPRVLVVILALAAAAASAQEAAPSSHSRHGHPAGEVADGSARPAGRPALEWTRYPLLLPVFGAGSGDRGGVRLRPRNLDAASLEVFAPDGPSERRRVSVPVGPDGGTVTSTAPKVGNYHWVVAREEEGDLVRVASTAWYFSNPGKAPTEMLAQAKSELEIVPDPLPREHAAYRESEKWTFVVRFAGRPLAGKTLALDTEFGSHSSFVTDAEGRARVLFPRDFRPAAGGDGEGGGHGPRRAKFVLAVEHDADGKHYLTGFNASYGVDADRGRSLAAGAGFGLLGMLLAAPLLRRPRPAATKGEPSDA